MFDFSRSDTSLFGRWWWTVDKVLLAAFFIMIAFGIMMTMAATPVVANRIGLEEFYFLKRHLFYLIPTGLTIFYISNLDNNQLKKFALGLYAGAVFLTLLTLFFGTEIKGAHRWITFCGLSIQPSEFAKPSLAIITAWMFANQQKDSQFRGKFLAAIFFAIFALLLVMQPDIGMLIVTLATWFIQLFANGLPIFFVVSIAGLCAAGFAGAYLFLPHVTVRVDEFLNPKIGDHYQINRSLEAFSNGGWFGVGPGEGIVKKHLPDAHADFVFAVLGEEFGFIFCLFMVMLIAFIVIYGTLKIFKSSNYFSNIALIGLLSQFGLQSAINIASSLHLIPTKGMTLPFISYGGSSMLASAVTIGMILALSKKNISLK